MTGLAGGEYLFLFDTAQVELLGQLYGKRWTIEQCFQNWKGQGFALRGTHLRCRDKLKKLVGLVSLAYAFCVSCGTVLHEKAQHIAHKKQGYKKASFNRHGLNALREWTRPGNRAPAPIEQLVDPLFRWLTLQIAHFQRIKIVG